MSTSLRRAFAAGVKIAAGTDAGGHGHPSNALEIECLVKAGLTPLQALRAATGWAAECLGREHEIGTVEKGKLADLVVVAGDPLADVKMLQDPERNCPGTEGRRDRRHKRLGEKPRASAVDQKFVEKWMSCLCEERSDEAISWLAESFRCTRLLASLAMTAPSRIPLALVFVVQPHPRHLVGVGRAGFVTPFGHKVQPMVGAIQHVEPARIA